MSKFYNGMIVYIHIFGLIEHPGVVFWTGAEWKVIHNSFWNGVTISTIDNFRNGKLIYVSKRYVTHRSSSLIVEQALSKLGQKWSPNYNCQHFVSDCCGLKPFSQDYEAFKLIGILGLGTLILK